MLTAPVPIVTICRVIPHRPKKCRICESALTVHQAARGNVCDARSCVAAAMRDQVAKRHADELAAVERVANQWLDALPTRTQLKNVALVALRSRECNMQPVPDDQQARLREHLQELLADAATKTEFDTADARAALDESLSSQGQPDAALAAACATCSGNCCRTGGSRAYIDEQTIARVRLQQPALSDDEILALYVTAIPALHVEDSCVFHGDKGCTLPRELRARICNEYYCRPLINWSVTRTPGVLAVAVVENSEVIRSTLVELEPISVSFVAATATNFVQPS